MNMTISGDETLIAGSTLFQKVKGWFTNPEKEAENVRKEHEAVKKRAEEFKKAFSIQDVYIDFLGVWCVSFVCRLRNCIDVFQGIPWSRLESDLHDDHWHIRMVSSIYFDMLLLWMNTDPSSDQNSGPDPGNIQMWRKYGSRYASFLYNFSKERSKLYVDRVVIVVRLKFYSRKSDIS